MTPQTSQIYEITRASAGLKILSFEQSGVPVQVRPGAPTLVISNTYPLKTAQSLDASKGVIWSDSVSLSATSDTTMTPLNSHFQFIKFEFIGDRKVSFRRHRGMGNGTDKYRRPVLG